MNIKNQRGYALLIAAIIIMLGIAITSLVASKSMRFEQKEKNNEYQQDLAFQAAEAGLEYGVAYLYNNKSAILVDADNNGYIDDYTNASITNVAFNNNTTYTITYTNSVISNFKTIIITSTGSADNGTATRKIYQTVQIYPLVPSTPPAGIVTKNSLNLSGSLSVTNTSGPSLWTGGSTTLSGSATTTGAGGVSSNSTAINSDVVQNDSGLSSLSNDQFFSGFFGRTKTQAQQISDLVYTNSSDTDYAGILNGVNGKSIWINQTSGTAALVGNATIGTAAQPVILVINGSFKATGNITVNGLIYIIGNWNNSGGGSLAVNGGIVVEGSMQSTGTPNVTYTPSVFTNMGTLGEYVKVPGSWHDF